MLDGQSTNTSLTLQVQVAERRPRKTAKHPSNSVSALATEVRSISGAAVKLLTLSWSTNVVEGALTRPTTGLPPLSKYPDVSVVEKVILFTPSMFKPAKKSPPAPG